MGSLRGLLGQLSVDPHVRGQQFELISQWFFRNTPLYQAELRGVWLWREWPGRWGSDAGIDLVGEASTGQLWAIQAKAYDPQYWIKKTDIDSFLSESARPQFAYRLIIATTNEIGATAKRTIEAQGVPVGLLMLADLEAAPVDWPLSVEDLRPRRPSRKVPFPHNREAVSAVCAGFRADDRGQLVMACGTGKTLVGLWTHEELACERALVLVPSLSLLAQTMTEWTVNAAKPFEVLAVCSDETVASEDRMVEHTSALAVPVTTAVSDIRAFIDRVGARVVFATYQSSPRVADAMADGALGFDLVIADEAHRCAGAVASAFGTVLDRVSIRSKRRLFMTATPRSYSSRARVVAGEENWDVASMDDPELFGPVFHTLNFGEAITRGLLSDYQVTIVGIEDATYRDFANRAVLMTTGAGTVTDARTFAGELGVAKAMTKYDLRRMVSFHSRVKSARRFSVSLPETIAWMPQAERPAGKVWSHHVSGEMPSGRRKVLLGRLRDLAEDERGLLSNARCLGEGVDVPAIDAVAFIDPRGSQIDIIQAVGRAIRLSPDKKIGTVVVPVFIDTSEDPELALQSSAFQTVWAVLKALRAHDEALGEQLDALRRELGRRGAGALRLPSKIKFDLPVEIGADFVEKLSVRLVTETTSPWGFWFGLLENYVEREGHAQVPSDHIEADRNLGVWVSNQRGMFASGRLAQSRAAQLDGLPGWVWDVKEASWEEMFISLQEYVSAHGTSKVPVTFRVGDRSLGSWVARQRVDYSRHLLAPERSARLESLSGWTWNPSRSKWWDGFERVKRLSEEVGLPNITQNYRDQSGFAPFFWIREAVKAKRQGKLSKDLIAALESLGQWDWGIARPSDEEITEHLAQVAASKGTLAIGRTDTFRGLNLLNWVTKFRRQIAQGTADPKLADRLTCLPGWEDAVPRRGPNTRDDVWRVWLGRLMETQQSGVDPSEIGQSFVTEKGERLGEWVSNQRRHYRAGRLAEERVGLLEQVPGWVWDSRATSFQANLDFLRRYAEREGTPNVPRAYSEDGVRAGWLGK